jgi:hypothetical protein
VIKNPNTIIEETRFKIRKNIKSLKINQVNFPQKMIRMMIVLMMIRIQNLNQKTKNLRRNKQMVKIMKAMNQAKRTVMGHSKMHLGLKKTNRRKRNLSKMIKENS